VLDVPEAQTVAAARIVEEIEAAAGKVDAGRRFVAQPGIAREAISSFLDDRHLRGDAEPSHETLAKDQADSD